MCSTTCHPAHTYVLIHCSISISASTTDKKSIEKLESSYQHLGLNLTNVMVVILLSYIKVNFKTTGVQEVDVISCGLGS
jgi:hypothetical protein